jgi:serine/threonine protein kinase
MDQERWSSIQRIFHGALEEESGNRAEYVSRECAGDEDVREAVQALLESDDQTSPVDRPLAAPYPEEILGHYRLLSKLGEGGMGVVYLARDLRLDRAVAIKILKAEFKEDGGRRRILAEAKAASALNHPNIITVHDVGSEDARDYLVMEYVPGKSLEQLIPHNGLKLKEALLYAIQIADALACAHRAGIIHRDLKPANVLITDNGVAKVVDFGIAKRVRAEADTGTLTERGLIFGSVAYMSPEQAEGKPVDARSDIFSFGSLLYEMVTGRRAFHRDTAASTLAAVLHGEPEPPLQIAQDMPPQLAQIIERCLRKTPHDRFERMEDVKAGLERVRQESQPGVQNLKVRRPLFSRTAVAIAAMVIIAIGVAAAALHYVKTSPSETVLTPVPLTTYPGYESNASFSPDGDQVAFSWCKYEGTPTWQSEYLNICNIFVKQIGVEPPFRLTQEAAKDFSPAWSPDGKWIAFLRLASPTSLALLVIPQRGGRERILQEHDLTDSGDMPPGPYLAWAPDSKWLVCSTPGSPKWFLSMIAVDSSERRVLSNPPSTALWGDTAPSISPDGRTLAFTRRTPPGQTYDIYTRRLSMQYTPEAEPVKLHAQGSPVFSGSWMADGSAVVFSSNWRGRDGLWRISATRGAMPQRLSFAPTFASEPAISRGGKRLAYTKYQEDTNIWRVEFTGRGRGVTTPSRIISSTARDADAAFSPDGTRIAFVSERSGAFELWLCDRDGLNQQQLTSHGERIDGTPRYPGGPQWSPDGQNIAVAVFQPGGTKVEIIDARTGALRVVCDGKWPSWSRDGQSLYFASASYPASIWKIPSGGGRPVQLTQGPGDDMPQSSPDGKFLYFNKGWPGPLSIWRIPVDGGEETKVVEGVSTGGQWTIGPDGVYFFTTPDAEGRSEMRVYEFASGRIRSILTTHRPDFRVAVSPDGRTILFAQIDELGSDLMLVEDFH